MGWDSDSHILLTAPISLGDISWACGRGGTTYDLGDMIANGTSINAMAKYKPFKNGNPAFANATAYNTARAAARYGMSEPPLFYPNSYITSPGNTSQPPSWTYNKPTAGQPNEWFRALDFDGYATYAVPPIYLECSGIALSAGCGAWLWKDQSVDHLYTDPWGWEADRSLSVSELLTGTNNYDDKWIALCFFRYNAAGTAIDDCNVIVTSVKFGDISSGGNPGIFFFNGAGQLTSPIDGKNCPEIPLLKSASSEGRNFLIVACLSTTGVQDQNNSYEVLPNNYSLFSLGFDATRLTDRVLVVAQNASSINKITAEFISGPKLVLRDNSGQWWRYDIVNSTSAQTGGIVQGEFTTAADYAAGRSFKVTTKMYVPSGSFVAPPGDPSAVGLREYSLEGVTFGSAGTTYTKNLVTTSDTIGSVYIYKDAPKVVVAEASYKYQNQSEPVVNFLNTLEITP